ncbi:hypothetical protein DSECCO2_143610 [anaerobic digester metagenome]
MLFKGMAANLAKSAVGLVLFLPLIMGCTSYKTITIQTLHYPNSSALLGYSKPLVLANYYPAKTSDPSAQINASLDSTLALEAAMWAYDYLAEVPMFAQASIPIHINRRFDSLKIVPLISQRLIDSLAVQSGADVIISLEYADAHIMPYYTGDPYGETHYQVAVYGFWRVYDVQKRAPVNQLLIRDTLYVADDSAIEGEGFIVGEELINSLSYAGSTFAAKFAAQFVPVWRDEERIFFSRGSDDMKNAALFAEQNQWKDAAAIWQRIYHSGNKTLSAQAAFNLALANEMNGNFDVALNWLDVSLDTLSTTEAKLYKNIIEYRMKEITLKEGLQE